MAIVPTDNPYDLFSLWYEEAAGCDAIDDHTAMTLATVTPEGLPDARQVLLKGHDGRGFVFYTNLTSPKARHLEAVPAAALCFYWMPLEKQVRIRGPVEPVTPEEADAYFASRPRQSQVGAWASKQSQPLESRYALEKRILKYGAKHALGRVPRPPFWSGFRVLAREIEFWLKMPYRLHDRVLYEQTPEGGWRHHRVYP